MADNNQIITRRMKDKGIDAFVDVYDGIYGDLANGTRDTIFGRIYESQPTLMWGKEVVDLITFRNRMLLKFGTLHRGGPTLTLPVDNEHEVLTYNGWIENNDVCSSSFNIFF